MDVFSRRCINCGLLLDHRLRIKYFVGEANHAMIELLETWISPLEPSPSHLMCKECFIILRTQATLENPQRSFGHRQICIGCGKSVLNSPNIRLPQGSAERNVLFKLLPPLKFATMDFACPSCWRRAQRIIAFSNQQQELNEHVVLEQNVDVNVANQDFGLDCVPQPAHLPYHDIGEQALPGSGPPPHQDVGIQAVPPPQPHRDVGPPPPPLPQAPAEIVNQRNFVAPTIRLPNYNRVAATSSHCLFLGCRNEHNYFLLPKFVKQKVLKTLKIYIPRNARVCLHHLNSHDWNELEDQTLIETFTAVQVEDIIHLTRTALVVFDFENIDCMDERVCHWYLGLYAYQFIQIHNELTSLPAMVRNTKVALAIYLMKLRTGDSDDKLSILFDMPRTTLERRLKVVRQCLITDYVPNHLGLFHISVQEVARRNLVIPEGLFINHVTDTGEQPAVVICDATYDYTQKSSNYSHQKKTYSVHKYRNLMKPFLLVCPDGYIVDIPDLYKATKNDATIMQNLFREEDTPMSLFFRKGDVFIVDRGFRDAIPLLESRGFKVFMPETVLPGNNQLTRLQANRTRFVTLVRWVVEVVNGRFKRDFKLLRQEYCNRSAPNLKDDFLICAAILNHFHRLIENRPDAYELVLRALSNLDYPNHLADYVIDNNLNRHRIGFVSINSNLPHLNDFPQLSMAHLELIALGTYQIKQSRSYYGEHVRDNGMFELEVNSEVEFADHPELTGTLIRGRIKSRHRARILYFTYIVYNGQAEHNENSIKGYYCSCLSGSRTVGCCAHVMVIIWYLGWARYDQTRLQPPAQILDYIFNEDVEGI